MGGAGPILETVARIAEDVFFEVIEITQINDPPVRAQVRALAQQAGVELYFGAQPILLSQQLDLNHADATQRRRAVQAVQHGIDLAAELCCRRVAILSGKVTSDKEAAKARLVGSIKELCAYAALKHITLVLETFDQVPFAKNCLIGPTKEAVEVSQEIRRNFPNFGLMLDLSHLPLLNESPQYALRTAAGHLVHAHIGNCAMDDPGHEAYGDNHPRFGAPGTRNGVPELAEFLRGLLDIGYLSQENRGILSFEVKPMSGESAEAVIAGSKRALLEAWRRI